MWFGTKEGKSILNGSEFSLIKISWHVGEGGSFALYQGLYPRKQPDVDADRTLTGESFTESIPKTSFKEKARWPLLLWVSCGYLIVVWSSTCN